MTNATDDESMRVQKFLSRAGVCSRREGEDLMRQGRVRINGEICREFGSTVEPGTDVVEVDGERIELPEESTYVLLHKPEDVVTTVDDPMGRETVVDLLPEDAPRLWPVGRLDRDSSGALLLTDDGDLTHRLTHPSFGAPKHYTVEIDGRLETGDRDLERLRNGVELDDGETTRTAEVSIHATSDRGGTILHMTLREGKNRQIRRMCRQIGFEVIDLHRHAIGSIGLDGLAPREWRRLSDDEVDSLYEETR